jgi:hypothetical protein
VLGSEILMIVKPTIIGSNHNESTMFVNNFGGTSEQGVLLNNGFRCGTAEGAKARYLGKVPVWRYHYSGTKTGGYDGAIHGQDVGLVFGDGKRPMNKYVQTVWADFAKNHLTGLNKWNWPMYNPHSEYPKALFFGRSKADGTDKTLVRLDHEGAARIDFVQADTYDHQCPTLHI